MRPLRLSIIGLASAVEQFMISHQHPIHFLYAYLQIAMAEESGITEDGLKMKIVNLLQATYVDIEDMSGLYVSTPLPPTEHTNLSTQVAVARHSQQ
jgi:hypothetical protein